ncbi:hypothetical protein G5T42_03110 [Microbacterium sp. 4R-513]|uniref:hypothetical protein n=1 Tax=Microbacterium sp. 4R-513 TaxID=2567934 RepID=UPI0013E1A6CF|nr:hypothetical protein [Microbacterium sp. 4R-513]QIG38600.1 hypothetical protein G5T42_03110 [Microbacterium sp. 4R-513]
MTAGGGEGAGPDDPGVDDPVLDDSGLDDRTVRVPRAEPDDATLVSPTAPVDATAVSPRRRELPDDLDSTLPAQPAVPRERAPGPRRTATSGDDRIDPEDEPDDGSTMVVRRESRRRAAARESARHEPEAVAEGKGAAPAPSGGAGASVASASQPGSESPGRTAQAPRAADAIYRPRAFEPAHVERAPRPERAPQAFFDTAAAEASARSRSRRRLALGIVVGAVIAIGAVALLTFIALTG